MLSIPQIVHFRFFGIPSATPDPYDAAAHWPPWFTKRTKTWHALWPIWCGRYRRFPPWAHPGCSPSCALIAAPAVPLTFEFAEKFATDTLSEIIRFVNYADNIANTDIIIFMLLRRLISNSLKICLVKSSYYYVICWTKLSEDVWSSQTGQCSCVLTFKLHLLDIRYVMWPHGFDLSPC